MIFSFSLNIFIAQNPNNTKVRHFGFCFIIRKNELDLEIKMFHTEKKNCKRLYGDWNAIKSVYDAKNKSSGQSNTRKKKLFVRRYRLFKWNSEKI